MVNGMMTLSGAWDKLRTDYVLRFLIIALPSTPCPPSRGR
jgi:cbb3-type cytochrome oxidase subunit 1